MDTDQIEYVLEVRSTMSMNKAAESLGVSQPTLSYQIKKLETELGFDIFSREGRGITLTPAGEQFCNSLFGIRLELRKTIEHCQNISGRFADNITVGLPERSVLRFLPEAIRLFSKEFPKVSVTPMFIPYGDFGQFLSGSIDIIFSERGALGKNASILEHHIYDSNIYLVTRDDDPLTRLELIHEGDLQGRALMVGGGSPPILRDVQKRVIAQSGVEYFNSNDHDTTLVNVASGKGVCLSPGFLMQEEQGFKWNRFDCPERFDCVLCTKANDTRDSVRRLVEIIADLYAKYDGPL